MGGFGKKAAGHARVRQLGPGLIIGAADDDPSGIATYSQAGAQFGYSMLWSVLFTYPLRVAIQMVGARVGCITGRGLAANVKACAASPPSRFAIGTTASWPPLASGPRSCSWDRCG
jgi:Mn2+/Fe2+ NRAMP family transporter